MDSYFAEEFERYGHGRPYASLIVARNERRQLSFGGRVFDLGIWLSVKSGLVVGERILREHARQGFDPFSPSHKPAPSGMTQERVAQLLGADAPHRLRRAVVGVVGCSGTGSPSIHLLARAEVGDHHAPGHFCRSSFDTNNHDKLAACPAQITGQRQKTSRERSDLVRAVFTGFRHALALARG